ncbi:MAG: phosphatidylinositol mannoside acyltransferase [Nocardioidaceae bacterium]|nr:phosphatidylinositol mannoside acyltransferase [Nocardioidaceae bacterium]
MVAGVRGGLRWAAESAAGHATTFGYLSGWRFVRLLPERQAQALFRGIADQMHRRGGRGVDRLRANLDRVRPGLAPEELDDLTRDALRSYLRYWCESFRLPSWPLEDLVARTRTVGEHHVRDALALGRGVVVPLPHMGNWDWAGAWACSEVAPLMTVAERLEPERLYDEFVAYRESLGMRILPLTGGDAALPQLEAWVRGGGLVCLLADRDLSRTSVEVTLCGHRARMPRGPAVLARKTGAPLVPVTLHYGERTMTLTFHEAVPHGEGDEGIAAMMQGVADAFTVALREHPQEWHMLQRVFVEDLS